MNIFASSGGGVRLGASFGAVIEGERQGKFKASGFQYYVGTSAGAFDAALTANGYDGFHKKQLFLNTEFSRYFTPALVPLGFRKMLVLKWPISLKNLAKFIDSLKLTPHEGLLINTVDAEANQQVIYCEVKPPWAGADTDKIRWEEKAFSTHGMGTIITRSMVLPGLVADDPKYMDGGVAENPALSILPSDAEILLIHLGYAGLVKKKGENFPQGALNQALYDYEFKAFSYAEHLMGHHPNLKVIYPRIFDVDSADFDLPQAVKEDMIRRAQENTREQWQAL